MRAAEMISNQVFVLGPAGAAARLSKTVPFGDWAAEADFEIVEHFFVDWSRASEHFAHAPAKHGPCLSKKQRVVAAMRHCSRLLQIL